MVIRGQKRPLRDDVDIAVAVGLFEFYVLLALLFAFRILKTLTNTTYNNDNSYLTSKIDIVQNRDEIGLRERERVRERIGRY